MTASYQKHKVTWSC